MILAQISDLHIKAEGKLSYRVVDTAGMLARCVEHIRGLKQRPALVVATGDLVDFGRPEEYRTLRELLEPLDLPLYLLPGNHDDRAALRRAFPDHVYLRQWEPFVQYAIDDWPVRIVALDTVIPEQSGGELCCARLDWLDRTLRAAPDKPTVVVMHHPPFATWIGHMDKIGLADSAGLAAVIAQHPQVERVLCGHLHRPIQVRFAGTLASTCPSPAHQVALDLAPDAPSRFAMEPPGYQLHAWNVATGLVSHTAFIGEFAGPYPFYDGDKLID
jgi:3',5'-cyclic AMP phosphodiesterase CpdA